MLGYHSSRTLSLKKGGIRVITPSTSWVEATMEMDKEAQGNTGKHTNHSYPLWVYNEVLVENAEEFKL